MWNPLVCLTDMSKTEECCCHSLCKNLFKPWLFGKWMYFLLTAGNCFRQPEQLYSTRSKIRNWLPGYCHCSVSQQCRRVCFCKTANQWVPINFQNKKKSLMFNLYICVCHVLHRVITRGFRSTCGPSAFLLSIFGLESAFISCAGLQTHLWTTRSGRASVCLSSCI